VRYFGERIRLRAIERDDLPRYVEWLSDPEVAGYLEMVAPMGLAQEDHWYESMLKLPVEEQVLAIDVRKGRGGWEHIGAIGFMHMDRRNRSAEFGIHIGPKQHRNKGLGRDSILTLLRYGFENLNLHRIWLRVFEFNQPAIHLYEDIGFVQEGTQREAHYLRGRYWDVRIYSMLRREWRVRYGATKE
jgi:diamine N-acetyltransferase